MRILVTGATGYLGLHVVGTLAEAGHAVTALVRAPSRLGKWGDHPNVTAYEASLEDDQRVEAALQGQDACVHGALIWGEPGTEFELRDTAAAAKLFDAAGRAGVSRTMFVSSTACHRPFKERMCEEDKLTAADAYGATKAAGELFLWAACATHAMEGIVIRPGPMVGPPALPEGSFRSHSRIEEFVERALRGQPICVKAGAGRQFVPVRGLADVIKRLLESSLANETYLCVGREITPWEWIARKLVELTQSTSGVVVEPPSVGQSVPCFDVSKLAAHLGVEFDSQAAMEAHLAHLVGRYRCGFVRPNA